MANMHSTLEASIARSDDHDANALDALARISGGLDLHDAPRALLEAARSRLDALPSAGQAEWAPATTTDDFVEAVAPDLASLRAGYENLFNTAKVLDKWSGTVAWYIGKLCSGRARYEEVEQRTGVPWWFVGITHAMEASFNFSGHLHNGDPLSARTVQVPKGRPIVWNPPNDWLSSAIDAMEYQGFLNQHDWSLAPVLYRFEGYNGYGYYSKNINSPYLWSFSNQYSKGKFVADHVFDPNAVSKQCGAAVMLRALADAGDIQAPG